MIIAVDFDGTMTVSEMFGRRPLALRPGAKRALLALHAAGHRLILHSARWGDLGTEADRIQCEAFLRAERLWSLFHVWKSEGKPYADVYLDDRAIPISDGRAGVGATWDQVASALGVPLQDETTMRERWEGAGDRPRLVRLKTMRQLTVWLVDGREIRDDPKTYTGAWKVYRETLIDFDSADFIGAGHGARYPWIPLDELWVEHTLDPDEIPAIVAHEAAERYWMLQGKDYDTAHKIATRVERKVREGEKDGWEATREALAGGSNGG